MRMTLRIACTLVAVFLLMAMVGQAVAADLGPPIPIHLRRVGTDSLSANFAGSVQFALSRSSAFTLTSGRSPGTLLLTIPPNLAWEKLGKRIRVYYTVEFASPDGQDFGEHSGYCWGDKLSDCAAQVVLSAKDAAYRARANPQPY
jgi:hypothetical protein